VEDVQVLAREDVVPVDQLLNQFNQTLGFLSLLGVIEVQLTVSTELVVEVEERHVDDVEDG
jgi:hypothetical protein